MFFRRLATAERMPPLLACAQILQLLWKLFNLAELQGAQRKEAVPGRPPLLLLGHQWPCSWHSLRVNRVRGLEDSVLQVQRGRVDFLKELYLPYSAILFCSEYSLGGCILVVKYSLRYRRIVYLARLDR